MSDSQQDDLVAACHEQNIYSRGDLGMRLEAEASSSAPPAAVTALRESTTQLVLRFLDLVEPELGDSLLVKMAAQEVRNALAAQPSGEAPFLVPVSASVMDANEVFGLPRGSTARIRPPAQPSASSEGDGLPDRIAAMSDAEFEAFGKRLDQVAAERVQAIRDKRAKPTGSADEPLLRQDGAE